MTLKLKTALKRKTILGQVSFKKVLIVITRLRPDIVLLSRKSKQVVMIELNVPWEDRFANEWKRANYQELVEESIAAQWSARCEPTEVGARGFIGQSLWKCLTVLGIVGKARRQGLNKIMVTAEKASRWIWLKRE